MNFGALSRGFGTCCLRFKNGVTTIPAKLASGWLARLYREGVERVNPNVRPGCVLLRACDNTGPPGTSPSDTMGLCMLLVGDFMARRTVGRADARQKEIGM